MTADQFPGGGATPKDAGLLTSHDQSMAYFTVSPDITIEEWDRQFAERSQAVFNDYITTMKTAVPNFDGNISLLDGGGKRWTVGAGLDHVSGEVKALTMTQGLDLEERRFFLCNSRLSSGASNPEYGHDSKLRIKLLDFVERKMAELLAPIKAAREKPLTPDVGYVGSGSTTDWRQLMEIQE